MLFKLCVSSNSNDHQHRRKASQLRHMPDWDATEASLPEGEEIGSAAPPHLPSSSINTQNDESSGSNTVFPARPPSEVPSPDEEPDERLENPESIFNQI